MKVEQTSASRFECPILVSPIVNITYVEWTMNCIQEELFQNLERYKMIIEKDGRQVIIHPYHERAKEIIYRIPVYDPPPVFVISLSTLTPEVRSRLSVFLETDFEKLFEQTVVDAVGMVFRNINERYYFQSVHKCLRVRFVR